MRSKPITPYGWFSELRSKYETIADRQGTAVSKFETK